MTIAVPRRYHVGLKTSGGNLTITQLQGNALGKTSSGDIKLLARY